MNKKYKIMQFGAILLSSMLALSACSGSKEKTEELTSIADTAITITEQLPDVKTLSSQSNYIGTVEADSTVYVIPKVSAEVLSKNFQVGDHVEAGDLLFTLDDSTAKIALDQANASLKSAQAGLSAAQASYEAGKAGYIAQEASNTAAHFAAIETLGKINTTGQQLQVAADSASIQARQAGLSADSAHETYDFYKDQLREAKDSLEGLEATRDQAGQALAGAQAAFDSATAVSNTLNAVLIHYNYLAEQGGVDGNLSPEEYLQSEGFSSKADLDAAIATAGTSVTAAQSALKAATNAYTSSVSAVATMEGTIDQLGLQKVTSGNTAESASLSYQLAGESASLAQRQKDDFDTYTRNTITSQAMAQVIGSDQQLAANGAQVRASGAQVDATSAGVEQANAAVKNALTALSYYKVNSPVSGTITEINISEHNMATSAQSAYTIMGDAPCKIVFYVPERTAAAMLEGDVITLEQDNEEFAGTIISVSNEIDPSTGLCRIEAQSLDPLIDLPHDSSVKLRAVSRRSQDALTVPVDSVYYDGEQAFVYTNDNGVARRVDVTVGISEGDSIEIREGLEKSDLVITSWNARLKDGARVMPQHDEGKKKDIVVVVDK